MTRAVRDEQFYERFWEDARYQFAYAFDSAVRDRYPSIQRVWGTLAAPGRLLDLGCGNGVLTYWMFANAFSPRVHGVDVSETAIGFATKSFAREGLTFDVLDTAAELAQLGTYDVVVASHVLEHLDDPATTLRQLAEIAEWAVIEVPLEDTAASHRLAAIRGRDPLENDVGHVQFWTRETFRTLMHECGFLIVKDHQYASAPFSPFNSPAKRLVEQAALRVLGVRSYGRLLATHYAVLARRVPSLP